MQDAGRQSLGCRMQDAGFGLAGVHRSVQVQDLGVNLAFGDLEGRSGAPSVPWTAWHGHCHDGVHREPPGAPQDIDPASGGVPGSRQRQNPPVPWLWWSLSLTLLPMGGPRIAISRKYPSCAQPGVPAPSTPTRTPRAGFPASRRDPTERPQEICPVPGIPGGSGIQASITGAVCRSAVRGDVFPIQTRG